MTTHVMRLVFNENNLEYYQATWLRAYDPSTPDGHGLIIGTINRDEALRGTVEELFALRNAISTTRPTRADGLPNRPLSAFSVLLEEARDGSS